MDFLRNGRTRAEFERFAAAQVDDLLRIGYLLAGRLQEAEDLVQECLLRVARRWPKVRSMEHPNAYTRKVLVNLAIDGASGRTRRWQELVRPDGLSEAGHLLDEKSAPNPAEARLDETELLDALRTLPARQRAVIVLRYFGDLSETQVAEALSCSVGTVKSTTSRGLTRLREALETLSQGHVQLEPSETNVRSASR